MQDLRIVIPAYNEEAGIKDVIERVYKVCPEAELIIVNDCSTDKTAQIAMACGAKVIDNPINLNYAGALKVGFSQKATPERSIKYIAFLDADGTYPPEKIPALYNLCKTGNYDIVVGSRMVGHNVGMPTMRRVGNKIFALLISLYTGKKITDSASGLRIFNIALIPWLNGLPNGLNFTPAMSVNALFAGFTYAEIPIDYARRIGNSKLSSVKDGYKFLSVIMNATRKYRPLLFYCTLGLPFMFVDYIVKIFTRTKLQNRAGDGETVDNTAQIADF
jgi:glycosyltransferase involved in cell wall biosynthesis